MPLTSEQMDLLVNEHFNYEATDDAEGVMSTPTEAAYTGAPLAEMSIVKVGRVACPIHIRCLVDVRSAAAMRKRST